MANRFIGGILSSKQPQSGGFVSRASTGTYFNNLGQLVTAPANQPRLNYSFNGYPASNRYSALFTSASTNYLSAVTAASAVGTGNFTMEFWWQANSTTQTNYATVINQGFTGSPSNGAFAFKVQSTSSVLNFSYYNGGISDNATSVNVNDLAWHHIAASRNGTNLGIYVDGVNALTITLPASFNMGASGGTTYIGYNPRDAAYINGYVKDVRLITGQALYSGTFTPPIAPLTTTTVGSTGAGAAATLTGTVLLLTSNGLNDSSSNNYAITNTNAVTASTIVPTQFAPDFSGTGWSNPTTLIEPASTNLIQYSTAFTNAFWTAYNSYITVTANSATAPDGTTTATTITSATGASQFKIIGPGSVTSWITISGAYTYSIFAKAGTSAYASIWAGGSGANFASDYMLYNLITGTLVASTMGTGSSTNIINVGNGWWRITWTSVATAGSNISPVIGIADASATARPGSSTTTGSLYIWGAQFEQGLTATSYIPTSGSTVTRSQDDVGPLGSGVYTLSNLQTQTAIDDQATVQSFTSTGSTTWTAPADVTSVEVLVVAGGGSGGGGSGAIGGGGGGAGGIIYNTSYPVTPGTTYPVVVGTGGVGALRLKGTNGGNSQFGALVALGGGSGAADGSLLFTGTPGGSGGGGSGRSGIGAPGTAGQGYPGSNGATSAYYAGGGGGGAGGPATPFSGSVAGSGGPGLYFNISGTSTAYGGGGGGGGSSYSSVSTAGVGGVGGGGAGTSTSINGNPGTANTGGGGGASGWSVDGTNIYGGNGGSGIVIVKYTRANRQLAVTSNAAVVVQKFSVSNVWTVPVGVTQVEALVVAGGGGGANIFGGGGAGGVVYNSALAVTPGSTYTIGVGAGGLGGAAATNTPNNGLNGFGSGIGTGTELITNGSGFTATTGWTATTATLSVPQTGTFRILPNASVNGTASQSITTVNGTTYVAVVKVTYDASKFFRLRIGTTQVGAEITDFFTAYTKDSLDGGSTGAGFYSTTFTATGSTTWINMQVGGGTQQPTDISYISVRQASLPATGGGYGGAQAAGNAGGSGGGGGDWSAGAYAGGAGTASQGNAGGSGAGVDGHGGGGGGAGSAGIKGITNLGGSGGAGIAYSISGNLEYYGGGGGGGVYTGVYTTAVAAQGGIGGGGAGGLNTGASGGSSGNAGSSNTGAGGGGGTRTSQSVAGGNGGSGVVVLRYRVPQVATFLDSGAWTCPAGVTTVQALVVAGGGGGGYADGGGGGAGGLIYSSSVQVTPGVIYPVVVGQGGYGVGTSNTAAGNGQNSSFANLIAIGGGAGGTGSGSPYPGFNGGSGGGASNNSATPGTGVYGQGNPGGSGTTGSPYYPSSGGGGAGAVGGNASGSVAGNGGAGLSYSISGSSVTYAGGGGGAINTAGGTAGTGGSGGGGNGGSPGSAANGTQNTGGGGGGGGNATGGSGGSGIVIIRYYGG